MLDGFVSSAAAGLTSRGLQIVDGREGPVAQGNRRGLSRHFRVRTVYDDRARDPVG